MNFLSKISPEVLGLMEGTAVVSICSNPPSPCPIIFQGMAYKHLGIKAFSKHKILTFEHRWGILGTYQTHDCCYFICHHGQSMFYSCGRRMFHSLEKMHESSKKLKNMVANPANLKHLKYPVDNFVMLRIHGLYL